MAGPLFQSEALSLSLSEVLTFEKNGPSLPGLPLTFLSMRSGKHLIFFKNLILHGEDFLIFIVDCDRYWATVAVICRLLHVIINCV